jgi:general secretion pathway protein D
MKKLTFVFVIVSVLWSCTTISQHYKSGYEAAMNKNWDKAVEHYEKALLDDPENSVYRLALYRAKVAASYSHLYIARNLAAQGKKEEALKEYEVAFSYDTSNMNIYEEARRL